MDYFWGGGGWIRREKGNLRYSVIHVVLDTRTNIVVLEGAAGVVEKTRAESAAQPIISIIGKA